MIFIYMIIIFNFDIYFARCFITILHLHFFSFTKKTYLNHLANPKRIQKKTYGHLYILYK